MYPLLSAAKSSGLRAVVVLGVALAAVLAVTASDTVGIAGAPVRSRWFVLLAMAVVCTVPLTPRFMPVELGLAHPLRCFATRLVVAAVPFGLGLGACLTTAQNDDAVRWWFVLLVASSILVSAFAPEAGWFACLGLGSVSILVDHVSATLPVTNLVTKGGAPVAFVTLAAASALYLARGGRPASK
ncbi:hypothetical protein ASG78_12925 [Nostocoides sp. Soil756]|nr:hypothetical protein ASG78_12925 [Tetrasphaera sp. Soil756]